MMLSIPTGILVSALVFLLTAGTIFAGDAKAVRKQTINSNVTYPFRAQMCTDDPNRYEMCLKADKPCHCEENRYEMYTYCKRSCGFCTKDRTPQRFWRVVNWAPLNRTWYINEIKFFLGKNDKIPLVTNDPSKAIASSTYLSFPASNAFDGNMDSAWLPDGWWERQAGGDWIGYDFDQPVDINSVQVVSDMNDTSDVAASMLIETGPTPFGPFETRWMIMNGARVADKRFHNPRCPMFWKRFMTDKDAFCYKLITEYMSWSGARDKCATLGADLVSINSHEEQIFVQQELLACGFTWLGFNDIEKEKHFKWSDGSNSTFFYWASDEEKDEQMNEMEDCAAMGRDGQWRQFNCEDRFYTFCKKRILTDSDKVVAPNTVSAPSLNKTEPTVLPSDVSLPPGITIPPPPVIAPYPYSVHVNGTTEPDAPPHAPAAVPPHAPAAVPPHAPGAVPPSAPGAVPPSAAGAVPPSVPGAVPPSAPGAVPPSAPGAVLPSAPGAVPPSAPGAVPPSAPGAVPPSAPGAVPPSAPGAVPPPAPAAVPPPAQAAVAPPAPAAVPPTAPVAVSPPAPAAVSPPAPAAVSPPAPAAVSPPAPDDDAVSELPSAHHHKKAKKEKKVHHYSRIRKGKKKNSKHHHKKKKHVKSSIEKKEKSLTFNENLQPVDDEVTMNDFLDMVTRSNIPKPQLSEKELRSNIRRQKMKDAERQLQKEKEHSHSRGR